MGKHKQSRRLAQEALDEFDRKLTVLARELDNGARVAQSINQLEGKEDTCCGGRSFSTPLEGRDITIEFGNVSEADFKKAFPNFVGKATPEENDEGQSTAPLADWEIKMQDGDGQSGYKDDMVVYISGPMTGYPDHNYPAFNDAAELLFDYGYDVVNPADNFDGRKDLTAETYLREDVSQMAKRCNAIYYLPGWQNSAGARVEYAVARALGFAVINSRIEGDDTDTNEPVEFEASRIVRNGERQQNYGHPNQDFSRTAAMWTGLLGQQLKEGAEITMQDVALMMGLLKVSRLKSSPGHHDSITDLIGYTVCYDRLGEDE